MADKEQEDKVTLSDLLNGKKVLVAEDMPVNQFYIRHVLQAAGATVLVVNNGREAVEQVRSASYDLLLMDIQMPEMDGVAATTIIRGLHDPQKANVPIIALTANVLESENQRYLAAGMNAFVVKPYSAEKFQDVIGALFRKVGTKSHTEVGVPVSASVQLYDLSMLESVSGGNADFVRDIIRVFLETVPAELDALTAAGHASAWEDVALTAHKLRSAVEHLGVRSLSDPVRRLEAANHDGAGDLHAADLSMLITHVTETMFLVFAQLRERNSG